MWRTMRSKKPQAVLSMFFLQTQLSCLISIIFLSINQVLKYSFIKKDSRAVDPRSNPVSGSALLMSEKSQAVYYISSCHMLIDKALSSDKPNGHCFEAD